MSYLDTARSVMAELHGDGTATKATEATKAPLSSHMSHMSQASTSETELLDRCRTACRGLSLWPAELAASLDEPDKAAIHTGDPAELRALRCFAESLAARLRTGKLPAHLNEAYARLRQQLAEHPSLRFASEVLTPDSDPVLIACAIRGRGFVTVRIERSRYDGFELIKIIDRFNQATQVSKSA